MNETNDRQQRTNNMGFAIAAFPCFADTLVQGRSSVLRMKFSAKNSPPSQPPEPLVVIMNDNYGKNIFLISFSSDLYH